VNAETQNLLKIHGSVLTYKGQAFAFLGPITQQSTGLLASLHTQGWATFSKEFINLDMKTGELGPFPNAVPGRKIFVRAFLILDGHSSSPNELVPCSPGVAVCEILSLSDNDRKNRKKIIERLCDLIPNISVYRLSYSTIPQVAELLTHTFCDMSIPSSFQSHVETTIMKTSTQSNDSPTVQLQISLAGGHQITAQLPKESPILGDLFSVMGTHGDSSHDSSPKVFHIPLNGNGSVCSFSRDQLVCVVTDSSVIPQQQEPIPKVEPPQIIPSHFVQIDNFLTESEKNQLLAFALEHEVDLVPGKVTGNTPDYRKSQVHYSFEKSALSTLIVERVRTRLPELLKEFNVSSYSVKHIETQLTASNDGDFFKIHNDNGFREGKTRELTYVYYFYREPKPFIGGELLLYDGKLENNTYARADTYKVIEPRNNSIVFFLSGCLHEVLHVRCPSQAFADSRFTVNGWVQRQKMLPPTGLPDSIKEWAKNLN
jgi:Rps23 Pro-64 3,4-dihydroxylase Tpa1-like proline 4-hydroxylase